MIQNHHVELQNVMCHFKWPVIRQSSRFVKIKADTWAHCSDFDPHLVSAKQMELPLSFPFYHIFFFLGIPVSSRKAGK